MALAELRELLAKATPAPWLWEHNAAYLTGPQESEDDYHGPVICGTHDKRAKENARLIEAMRNCAAELLNVVDSANRAVSMYRSEKRTETQLAAIRVIDMEKAIAALNAKLMKTKHMGREVFCETKI